MARVVTREHEPAACIAAVQIRKIDGEPVELAPTGFELEPGLHSMNGVAVIDTQYCRPVSGPGNQGIPDLQADFESGNTYYIGLDYSDPDSTAWKLVIWKTESAELQENGAMLKPLEVESLPR